VKRTQNNTRLLRVEAPHFVAGAVWAKDDKGNWYCTKETAPILKWMINKSAGEIKNYLVKKGWDFIWL